MKLSNKQLGAFIEYSYHLSKKEAESAHFEPIIGNPTLTFRESSSNFSDECYEEWYDLWRKSSNYFLTLFRAAFSLEFISWVTYVAFSEVNCSCFSRATIASLRISTSWIWLSLNSAMHLSYCCFKSLFVLLRSSICDCCICEFLFLNEFSSFRVASAFF